MSRIGNLERMKAKTFGRVKDWEKRAILESTRAWAMPPGLAKIIMKVPISRHFERHDTTVHIAENASCVDYADTWSSKRLHWLSKGQSRNRSTICYGCENTVEFNTGVAWVSLPITRVHPRVAEESKILHLPAARHNSHWMGDRQVGHGGFEAIPILDPVDVKKVYSYSASCLHSLQWDLQSYAWRYASLG